MRFVGSNAFSAAHLKAIHLNDGLRVLDEGAFFSYGEGKGVTVPASVIYIGIRHSAGVRSTRTISSAEQNDRRLRHPRYGGDGCAGLRREQ